MSTVLILSDADLNDATNGATNGTSHADAPDQDGRYHDLPRISPAQAQALVKGEIVRIDDHTQMILPAWPKTVRDTHLGSRPAEQLVASLSGAYAAELQAHNA